MKSQRKCGFANCDRFDEDIPSDRSCDHLQCEQYAVDPETPFRGGSRLVPLVLIGAGILLFTLIIAALFSGSAALLADAEIHHRNCGELKDRVDSITTLGFEEPLALQEKVTALGTATEDLSSLVESSNALETSRSLQTRHTELTELLKGLEKEDVAPEELSSANQSLDVLNKRQSFLGEEEGSDSPEIASLLGPSAQNLGDAARTLGGLLENVRRRDEILAQSLLDLDRLQITLNGYSSRVAQDSERKDWIKSPPVLRLASVLPLDERLILPLLQGYLSALGGEVETLKVGSSIYVRSSETADVFELISASRGEALDLLANSQADLAVVSSPATNDESNAIRSASVGDLRSAGSAKVLALDALVLYAHEGAEETEVLATEIPRLIRAQTWPSGRNLTIVGCDPMSDDAHVAILLPDSEEIATSGGRPAHTLVGRDPASLGLGAYSSYRRSPQGAKILAVRAGSEVRPLVPSPFSIATEDYRYTTRVMGYHPSNGAPQELHDFLSFVSSNPGQDIISSARYIDRRLQLSMPKDSVNAAFTVEMATKLGFELASATRLNSSLRFAADESHLDLKASSDLNRLVSRLGDPDLKERELVLVGFADSDGSDAYNLSLSQERAETVAQRLEISQVPTPHLVYLGEKYPIDENGTERGKARNRRVEVWLVERK